MGSIPRSSIVRFGIAIGIVIVGVVCTRVFSGVAGIAVGVGLAAIGLIAIVSLVFYEIGLSEDRDRRRHPRG